MEYFKSHETVFLVLVHVPYCILCYKFIVKPEMSSVHVLCLHILFQEDSYVTFASCQMQNEITVMNLFVLSTIFNNRLYKS